MKEKEQKDVRERDREGGSNDEKDEGRRYDFCRERRGWRFQITRVT